MRGAGNGGGVLERDGLSTGPPDGDDLPLIASVDGRTVAAVLGGCVPETVWNAHKAALRALNAQLA